MKDCPVCFVAMDEVSRSGVTIDICPKCKGIWLERGELNRLMASAKEYCDEYEGLLKPPNRDYDFSQYHPDEYRGKREKHHKKPGIFGLLEDIFD
jgi:hypothetical protein